MNEVYYDTHELPTVLDLKNWFIEMGQVFKRDIDRETIFNLYWDKCKDIRLQGANVAALFFHMRTKRLEQLVDTELQTLILKGCGLKGMMLKSVTL